MPSLHSVQSEAHLQGDSKPKFMRRMFSLDQLKPDTTKPWKWLSNAMLKFRRSRAPLAKRPSITKTKVRSTSKEPIPEPRPAPQIDDQSQVGQRSTSLQFLEQSIPVQVEKPPVKVEVTKLIGPRSSSVSLLLEPTAVDQQFIDRHLERVNTKRSSLGRTGSMRDPVRPLAMDPRKLSIRRTKKVDDKVEPTIVMGTFDGVPVPFQGSLLDLVEFAINEPLSSFAHLLLLTYRHFVTSYQLIHTVHKLYVKLSMTTMDLETPSLVSRHRLASFAKKWMEMYPQEFSDPDLRLQLESFMETVSAAVDDDYIQRLLLNVNIPNNLSSETNSIASLVSSQMHDFDIFAFSDDLIAKQMTVIDYSLFQQITDADMIRLLDGHTDMDSTSRLFVERCNSIGFWVATMVVSQEDIKTRIATIEKLINIAQKLFQIQNYSGCMSILSGLSTFPVARLKKTFEKLSTGSKFLLRDLEAVFDFQKNFTVYRKLQEDCQGPMVPFLGVIMKDLSVIRETRPSVTDNGLLNFERSWEIYGVLKQMSDYQADPFVFPELDMDKQQFYGANHSRSSSSNSGLSMYCYHLPCDNEKVLDEKSKIIEPPSEQEDELGVLQSLWRNLGESVQLTVLKVHETRTRDPVERVKNARRFRTSAKEVLHRITPNGSVFFNQSQIFNESTIFSKQQDDLDEVNVL